MRTERKHIVVDDVHMQAVRYLSELVARRAQVRWLRKMCKELYKAITLDPPWTEKQMAACKRYEKEML